MNSRLLLQFWALTAVCLISTSLRAHVAVDEMAAAANKLLAALDSDQKAKAQFDFKAGERENWHYIPKSRNGLPIKEMNPAQRKLAHALLSSGFSGHGYE